MNPPPPSSAIVPAGGAQGPPSLQQIGNLVRFWVHYDSMLTEMNKQIKQAREMRRNYESQILQGLRAANMQNPVIQITGGRITLAEEKHQTPLTFKNIEILLNQYYRQRPGAKNETADIIKYLRTHRETEVTHVLKRTNTPAPGPAN